MNCTHRAIRSWSQLDGSPVEMWSCVDCGWRFEPLIDKKEASNSTEPVAWLLEAFNIDEHKTLKRVVFDKPNVSPGVKVTPYYMHQPERKPLTEDAIAALLSQSAGIDIKLNGGDLLFARAIERAHGIGGKE